MLGAKLSGHKNEADDPRNHPVDCRRHRIIRADMHAGLRTLLLSGAEGAAVAVFILGTIRNYPVDRHHPRHPEKSIPGMFPTLLPLNNGKHAFTPSPVYSRHPRSSFVHPQTAVTGHHDRGKDCYIGPGLPGVATGAASYWKTDAMCRKTARFIYSPDLPFC